MKPIFLVAIVLSMAVFVSAQAPKSNWAKFEGNKVRYYDIGDRRAKNAIVLVHCWTCNVEFWKDSYNAFPGYRVIAMDLPGHGESDKPKVDYTMDYFARSVDAVVKKAGIRKAVLVGHSMGTPIIRRFYELHPEKTLGLVIVDGALLSFGPRAEVEKFFTPLLTDYRANVPTFLDGMLTTTSSSVKDYIRTSMLSTPDYVGQSAMKSLLDDSYANHGNIRVPVLAIMDASGRWPKDLETQYKTIAPNIDFRTWTGVSHFLHMEKPKNFNEAVSSFITSKKLL